MTARPKLYPSHQHQWAYPENPGPDPERFTHTLVRCTVCGFTAPRTLAKLDGVNRDGTMPGELVGRGEVRWPELLNPEDDTDIRCTHQDAGGQCLDHQGHAGDHQHPQPEQETR